MCGLPFLAPKSSSSNQAGLPPQQIAQLRKRARVDHVIRRQPSPSRLVDAEAHVPKRVDGMGIRRNRELDAGFLRCVRMDVVQIEPVWLGVDLEMAAKLAGGSGDALHVDVKGLALTNQPPRRMTENGDVTVLNGADDAIRLGLARQVEMRVHG